ncbi:PfkB family carbohydrate kinase [Amnibacterium sp.]|uniref:PfkB family carbohydrate kinase n=1 Tax=Amnibacterium sp. TaxID=1872496 RepID=UPI002605C2BB|nr:PfkB family carbohydrate kinase [Amnibacterium sp.]MCU1472730.1 PfkB domain protein [Amnibacterium sp.]
MTGRVVTLGNAVVDLVAAVPALPTRGSDVVASDGGPVAGGGGLRMVLAVRAAGGAAAFAGRIGTGPLGRTVGTALETARIPVLTAPVPDRDTGLAVTLVEPDGERAFVTLPGAELADPALADVRFQADDLVHVSGYGLQDPERTAAITRVLEALPPGTTVLLDPGPLGLQGDAGALLARVDWWSGTEDEATAATGITDPVLAAAALAGRMRRGAVVRRGSAGCVLAVRGNDPLALPAPRVVARSTNGAGDTHVGTFLAALASGAGPHDAAVRANEAAAAFVAG